MDYSNYRRYDMSYQELFQYLTSSYFGNDGEDIHVIVIYNQMNNGQLADYFANEVNSKIPADVAEYLDRISLSDNGERPLLAHFKLGLTLNLNGEWAKGIDMELPTFVLQFLNKHGFEKPKAPEFWA